MTLQSSIISPKKLIEVALPLDAINAAAARAVIFSQLVNDPEDLWRCQNPWVLGYRNFRRKRLMGWFNHLSS